MCLNNYESTPFVHPAIVGITIIFDMNMIIPFVNFRMLIKFKVEYVQKSPLEDFCLAFFSTLPYLESS